LSRFSAKINVMGEASLSEQLRPVGEVVIARHGPVIASGDHLPAAGTIANVRDVESTLTRLLFQGFIKFGGIEKRHCFNAEHGVMGDGTVARDDVELRTA
jgi:hypothetical protein